MIGSTARCPCKTAAFFLCRGLLRFSGYDVLLARRPRRPHTQVIAMPKHTLLHELMPPLLLGLPMLRFAWRRHIGPQLH